MCNSNNQVLPHPTKHVYEGGESSFKKCPGGGQQGGLLTCIFFLLQVNKAGSPCSHTKIALPSFQDPALRNEREEENRAERPALRQENVIPQPCHNQKKLQKKSYIDDRTLLVKVSLSDLQQKKRIIGPLDFNNRFNLALPPEKSILQNQFED